MEQYCYSYTFVASAIQSTHFPAKYPAQWALEVAHVKFDLKIIIVFELRTLY